MSDNANSNMQELTVSELSGALKRTIETTYDHVRVRGELGRVTIARSGHMYADLKDEKAVLSTVMWKGQVSALSFRPEEGLEVVASGRLSTYPGRSNYQLIASTMRPAGAGALMALLEERKKKLTAEGLFRQEHKKQLPYLPATIGVVTSPTGAVIRDILHRISDRFPARVILWPALVQGESAAAQIEMGIRGFNAMPPGERPDVLIVGRGGGSIEDLWPFNEENVVRAAFESSIPLISAVGHETDTTLIDYVSDARAPTPTGAAEIAVPVRSELILLVREYGQRSQQSLLRMVGRLSDRSASLRLPAPDRLLQTKRQGFDHAASRLGSALKQTTSVKQVALAKVASALRPDPLKAEIRRNREALKSLAQRARPALQRSLARKTDQLSASQKLLETLSYQATLKRGFTIVRDGEGKLIRSSELAMGASVLNIDFADGTVEAVPVQAGTPPPAKAHKPAKKRPATKKPDQGSLF